MDICAVKTAALSHGELGRVLGDPLSLSSGRDGTWAAAAAPMAASSSASGIAAISKSASRTAFEKRRSACVANELGLFRAFFPGGVFAPAVRGSEATSPPSRGRNVPRADVPTGARLGDGTVAAEALATFGLASFGAALIGTGALGAGLGRTPSRPRP